MSFWGSLFGGSNPTLNKDINQAGSIGGFATGLGEKNATQGSTFFSNILSGDQSKIAKSLAPQISTIQKQGEQQKKTNAEFNNRSGGTNAQNQQINDSSRASINDMVAKLLGASASNLLGSGQGLIGAGLDATNMEAGLSQERVKNWENSILGRGITGAAATAESAGLDAGLPGASTNSFG